MRPGFLPVKDLDLLAWSRNFAARLSADPLSYGVSVADAAGFAALHDAFFEAMRKVEPAIRSRTTVATKNAARLALESDARRLNALVRGSGVVDDAGLVRLGLTVHKKTYRRIGPPTDQPVVQIRSVNGLQVALHLCPLAGGGAGLPPDVAGATVYRWIGDEPPTDASLWTLAAHATRANIVVTIDVPPGTKVHFAAYYLNRRGERGPMGPSRSTYTLGGIFVPALAA